MKSDKYTIFAEELFDGTRKVKNVVIEISGNKITSVGKGTGRGARFRGIVTPAFIDAHSHIGMFRQGEPGGEQEGNDYINQIQPLSDPLNSIYMDDLAFGEAITFGVLYSCIIPGSGNVFGGRARIIRHDAPHKAAALVRDYGYKMALGYNPRSTTGWKGDRPNTRMGVYSLLEERFDDVLTRATKAEIAYERKKRELEQKRAKKEQSKQSLDAEAQAIEDEYQLELSAEDMAILEALSGGKPVKVHVHKEDDVVYLIELTKKYDMRVTAEHTGDVFHEEIFRMLKEEDIPIVFGPLGSHNYKVELIHSYHSNSKLLMASGANFGLMTDHPVIHVAGLRESLKFFLIFGMSDVDAIALITRKNAEILGIDDILGTVKPGKLASLLVWDGHPLNLASHPRTVIGEGRVLRKQ